LFYFPPENVQVVNWVTAGNFGNVDEIDEIAGTEQMPEKTMPQSLPSMSSGDQPRDVRENEFSPLFTNDTQVRTQSGKGVIGDFRPGRTDMAKKSRFAGVRQSDQSYVGQKTELESEAASLARNTLLEAPRSLIG
jgi:hypothetical protein